MASDASAFAVAIAVIHPVFMLALFGQALAHRWTNRLGIIVGCKVLGCSPSLFV